VFRNLRIAVLLAVLVIVAGQQLMTPDRLNSWDKPLWVTVFPVPATSSPVIRRYVETLDASSFAQVGRFLKRQASRHGRQMEVPVVIQVARPLAVKPPALPKGDSRLAVAWWSLKMRWWSFRHGRQSDLAPAEIKLFMIYDEKQPGLAPERSVGVRNAAYGIVNAIASRQMAAHNRIVITHELLHILGASDKYDPLTGQPMAPDGLADPGKTPRYPQQMAEIMAGRIAVSETRWRRAATLDSCQVGTRTAEEIGWL
jgi:hypothetical protein